MDFHDFITSPPTEIVKHPATILRQIARPIPEINDAVRKTTQIMLGLMRQWKGIGLAAPQVGLPYRLFVVSTDKKEWVFVNPEIIRVGTRTNSRPEGCLSLPGVVGLVERSNRFLFQAQTLDGGVKKYAFEGLMARVCQHENDHLNGILIIDKISEQDLTRAGLALNKLK